MPGSPFNAAKHLLYLAIVTPNRGPILIMRTPSLTGSTLHDARAFARQCVVRRGAPDIATADIATGARAP
jgi:hypothetical protein